MIILCPTHVCPTSYYIICQKCANLNVKNKSERRKRSNLIELGTVAALRLLNILIFLKLLKIFVLMFFSLEFDLVKFW